MVAIDVEMPKNCIFCPLYVGNTGEGHCAITHKWNATGGLNRLDDCPLTEIEQSEDCVDRNHVITTISQHHFDKDKGNFDLLIHNLCKEINELPPITPIQKDKYELLGEKFRELDTEFMQTLKGE